MFRLQVLTQYLWTAVLLRRAAHANTGGRARRDVGESRILRRPAHNTSLRRH